MGLVSRDELAHVAVGAPGVEQVRGGMEERLGTRKAIRRIGPALLLDGLVAFGD